MSSGRDNDLLAWIEDSGLRQRHLLAGLRVASKLPAREVLGGVSIVRDVYEVEQLGMPGAIYGSDLHGRRRVRGIAGTNTSDNKDHRRNGDQEMVAPRCHSFMPRLDTSF